MTPAEQLLQGYGINQPRQIDLEAIAFDLGAQVKYRVLDGCAARLVAGKGRAIITINTRGSTPGHQRFSLAHELAHWICERRTGTLLCAQSDIRPQNAQAQSIEAQANAYASQLVLPTYMVDAWLAGKGTSFGVARSLADDFEASKTAATIKLVKRTNVAACVVCHTRSGLAWHQRSPTFPDDYYVLHELHHDTAAFTLVFGGAAPLRGRRELAGHWFTGPDSARRDVMVESMGLPDGKVLSLLVLNS